MTTSRQQFRSRATGPVLTEKIGAVAVVTLNRPDKLNAIDMPLRLALADVIEAADRDTSVRAVVLTGAGKAFCSGGDITSMERMAPEEALERAQQAELVPGDAIYIPFHWWHHVESLDGFNVLVNYWWADASNLQLPSPLSTSLLAMLTMRSLPPQQQRAFLAMIRHYVLAEGGEKVNEATYGEVARAIARQRRDMGLRNAEDFPSFGLGDSAVLDDAVDL